MGEKRRQSSPNVPIPVEELERQLGLDREYTPVPSDETPTAPDLTPACSSCFGAGKKDGKTCPSCNGAGVVRVAHDSTPPAREGA